MSCPRQAHGQLHSQARQQRYIRHHRSGHPQLQQSNCREESGPPPPPTHMTTFLSLLAVANYLLSCVHPQDQISLLVSPGQKVGHNTLPCPGDCVERPGSVPTRGTGWCCMGRSPAWRQSIYELSLLQPHSKTKYPTESPWHQNSTRGSFGV